MQYTVFALIAFLIALCAFVQGVFRLFKKGMPMYFQLIVCAVGCFTLEQLSSLVNIWCRMPEGLNVGILGIFGCGFFLLSANYGTFDSIIDDGSSGKEKITALAAPLLFAILILVVFFVWSRKSIHSAVILAAALAPCVPASYFSFKHLLLPPDDFGLLLGTRACNIVQLCFLFAIVTVTFMEACLPKIVYSIGLIVLSLISYLLTQAAVRGAKAWRT